MHMLKPRQEYIRHRESIDQSKGPTLRAAESVYMRLISKLHDKHEIDRIKGIDKLPQVPPARAELLRLYPPLGKRIPHEPDTSRRLLKQWRKAVHKVQKKVKVEKIKRMNADRVKELRLVVVSLSCVA